MEFGLLGPLEVRREGRPLPIGRGKQRSLLALLLLNANRVVSSDRLVDELWGERPPPTVATALQVYVGRLRKALGAEAILTRYPGYVMELDPEQLDLHRFERLGAEGRHALAAGDALTAAELLREALDLWRGPPLVDVAFESFARPESTRLEELRLAALEDRIDADLALGRHAQLVGELEALVAQHPLRERLRGQLMLALYRSGRQADALEAYASARRALVEELGLDPSAPLQELERAILRQDTSLAAPETIPAPVGEERSEPRASERKLVTVLLVELGGAGDEVDPERAGAAVARAASATVNELQSHGAVVEHGIADDVLAVFGAPAAQEDHAERALAAALAVGESLEEHARIAVESGEVLVSPAGEHPFAGPPFRAAARLVREAEPGEIVVGERAAAAARGAFELAPCDAGRRLVRALDRRPRRGAPGVGRTFVGRASELALLQAAHERVAAERRPHLAAVLGEPGIGKTSVLEALKETLPARGARWYHGRCLPYGRASAYLPLAALLRDHLPGREILKLALGAAPAEELHPREARERLHAAIFEVLSESAAVDSAVLVVVEDVHWAEDALLELLQRAVEHVDGPVLVAVTARPELLERAPAFAGGRDASRVWLEPLPADEAERMLDELVGPVPDAVRELVLGRAEGNPFFLEEALATLVDRGILRREGDCWFVATAPGHIHVSDSVHAVLAARIDLLPEAAKRALEAAAVVGRSFWEGAVRELVADPAVDLGPLVERGFVLPSGTSALAGEREYAFKHALTRDVAYETAPLARRARLHAGFAEWLERSGRALDDHASLLAHHYAEAVAPEHADLAWPGEPARARELRGRAVLWLRRAADLALGRYEVEEALKLLERAVDLEDDTTEQALIWQTVAHARETRFDMEGFRQAIETGLALGPPPAAAAQMLSELVVYGGGRPYMWKEPPPAELVEEWGERARALAGEEDERVRLAILVARALSRPEEGAEAAREALVLAERLGEPEWFARAYEAQLLVSTAAGDLAASQTWADRQIALADELADPDMRGSQYFFAAFAYLRLGRFAEARTFVREHDAIVSRLSSHHLVHAIGTELVADTLAGGWDAALDLSPRAEAAALANESTPCQFNWRSLLMCALAAQHSGEEGAARRLEGLAEEAAAVWGALRPDSALLRLVLARRDLERLRDVLAADPIPGPWDVDLAAARIDALLALGEVDELEAEAAPLLGTGGYAEPFALRALGRVRGDRDLVESAMERFAAMGLTWRAEETRASLA